MDVNRRIVYHSIETGSGYEGLASFCSIMNMPCITKTAYYQHVETILDALELEAENDMKQAGQRLRQHILPEIAVEIVMELWMLQLALMVRGQREASLLLLELCLSSLWTLGKCWITMSFPNPARVVR